MSTLTYAAFMNERTAGTLDWLSIRFARIAVGVSFLSAVADRFGFWGRDSFWGDFAGFEQYTAKVCSIMPPSSVPFLAWAATIAEIFLGLALLIGVWPRWIAWASALLLALFALAMAISLGIKPPIDYSVFTAAACAVLLARAQPHISDAKS